MLDLLVLSPHLDDAALSCGGTIARATRSGESALIVTIFAGDEPRQPPSSLARDLARWWALPPGAVMAHRRAEDLAAAAELGAKVEQWPLLEAPYRRDGADRVLYPTLDALFAQREVQAAEPELLADLSARFAALPAATRVLAPLGVGRHVDHLLVRAAARATWGERISCYEEYPYAQWKWLAVWRATRPRSAWQAAVQPLAEEDRLARCAAIACYRSQLGALFGGEAAMRRKVARYVRRVGGERTWQRLAEAAAGEQR